MRDIGREANETAMEKCHGLMAVRLKVNGSLIREFKEQWFCQTRVFIKVRLKMKCFMDLENSNYQQESHT